MTKPEEQISKNLYEFYDRIAEVCSLFAEKQEDWSVLKNAPGCWPRMIYQIQPKIGSPESSALFSEKLNSGIYPEVLIAGDNQIRETDPLLRTYGFHPYSAWKGMFISHLREYTAPVLPDSVQIIKPGNTSEITEWLNIVNTELLTTSKLEQSVLNKLLAEPEFDAFLLTSNGIGVSTILTFESEAAVGLYFIATSKSAQKQGFAGLLIQHILSYIAQSLKKPVILQATPKGETLYAKLGFLPFNQFFLYRYLKING